MKFAIKGHSTRGKEIIQILESLGGMNNRYLSGDAPDVCSYYIDDCNSIRVNLNSSLTKYDYKFYTLEEFEKEFPFKIGDKVTIVGLTDYPKVITKMTWMDNEIVYTFGDNTWYNTGALRKLEMKEERNITLTLDKAKEWYKKGGELKEIALQAFTEKELTKIGLPKTWEEFCRTHDIMPTEALITSKDSDIQCLKMRVRREAQEDRNMCPSRASAEAHLAMMQLEQLRNCWRQGWEPDWNDDQQAKYCVVCYHEEFKISILYSTSRFLSFPTMKMAEEFLECFKDLIEKAGDLI